MQTCAGAEVPTDNSKAQKSSAAKGKPAARILTGKEKAQAIIDAALAEVKQDFSRKANSSSGERSAIYVLPCNAADMGIKSKQHLRPVGCIAPA